MAAYQKNSVDFFNVRKLHIKETKPKGHPLRTALIVLICAALAVWAGTQVVRLTRESAQLDADIAERVAFVDDEGNIAAAGETEAVMDEAFSLEEYNAQCEYYRDFLEGTDRLGSEHLNVISSFAPAGVTITSYSYADGAVVIHCVARDKDEPAAYAERLDTSEEFVDVVYRGFSASGQGDGATYGFTITCRFDGMD